jgi:hypothetical protein
VLDVKRTSRRTLPWGRSANLVVCGWRQWNLRWRRVHFPPLRNHQVSVSVHAIDVPTDCMSPDITKSKLKHQLVAVAQHHRQPTHGVSGPRASSSRIVQQNVGTCQHLQVEGDLGAMSALLDPQRDHQKKLPILSMTDPRMMWLNQPRIVLPRVPTRIPSP